MGNNCGNICTTRQKHFVCAAGKGSVEDVEHYLQVAGSVDVNKSQGGLTALGNACYNNRSVVVKSLCKDPEVDTSLYAACRFENKECVVELMKHKQINPNKGVYEAKKSGGEGSDLIESPLGVACRLGDTVSAHCILKSDLVNPNIGGRYGSCLRVAVTNKRTAIAEKILKHKNTRIHSDNDLFPETPILTLLVSIKGIRIELVRLFLSKADLELNGEKSASALIRSVVGRRLDILDHLLNQVQIEVNATMRLSLFKADSFDIEGQVMEMYKGFTLGSKIQNVLHYACSTLSYGEMHMALLESILKHPKIEFNVREGDEESEEKDGLLGPTPFFIAARRNLVEVCRLILDIGGGKVDVDAECRSFPKSEESKKKKKEKKKKILVTCTAFDITTNEDIKKMITEHREKYEEEEE